METASKVDKTYLLKNPDGSIKVGYWGSDGLWVLRCKTCDEIFKDCDYEDFCPDCEKEKACCEDASQDACTQCQELNHKP